MANIFISLLFIFGFKSQAHQSEICAEKNRIVVIADQVDHFRAQLQLILNQKIVMSVPVNIGRNGVGWHLPMIENIDTQLVPEKHEGDGKTPLGKYELKQEFGFAPTGQSGFSYLQLTDRIECVDDVESEYYNQIVDHTQVKKIDWNSSEKMAKIPSYIYGFNIEYQSSRMKKEGSCLFVHTLSDPQKGTAGCVAVPINELTLVNQKIQAAKLSSISIYILTKKPNCQ